MKLWMIVIYITLTLLCFGSEDMTTLQLGVGGIGNGNIYKGDKSNIMPVPLIRAQYYMFSVEFDTIKIYANENMSLGIGMGRRGYTDIEGMDDKKMAVLLSGEFKIPIQKLFDLKIKLNKSIITNKAGESAEFYIERKYEVNSRNYGWVTFGGEYVDKKTSDYYFGVNEKSGIEIWGEYRGKPCVIIMGRINYIREWTEQIYSITSLRCDVLPEAVYESPIVKNRYIPTAAFGLVYKIW